MDMLAASLNIAKATLYHYFRSKEQILYSIHDEFIELVLSKHLSRLQAGADAEALVRGAMGDVLGLMETHRGYVRVFFENYRQLSITRREEIREKRIRYEHAVQDAIAGVISQSGNGAVDPALATLALFGMCNWAYQWYHSGSELTTEEIAEAFWRILLTGVGGELDAGEQVN